MKKLSEAETHKRLESKRKKLARRTKKKIYEAINGTFLGLERVFTELEELLSDLNEDEFDFLPADVPGNFFDFTSNRCADWESLLLTCFSEDEIPDASALEAWTFRGEGLLYADIWEEVAFYFDQAKSYVESLLNDDELDHGYFSIKFEAEIGESIEDVASRVVSSILARLGKCSSVRLWLFPQSDWALARDSGISDFASYQDLAYWFNTLKAEYEYRGLDVIVITTAVAEMISELEKRGLENTPRNRAELISHFALLDNQQN